MSKYLMKSAAAFVLGLAATACSHDFDFVVQEEQKALDNAQATLGFYIPEDQDWKMSSEANVDLVIPGDANESYTVMVFSNNPLEDGIGYYLTKETLKGGQKLSADISYPAHLKSLVIGITDNNNVTTYKSASVNNGQITALSDIGSTSAVRTRAVKVNYSLVEHTPSYPNAPEQPTFSEEVVMPTTYKNTLAEAKTIPGIAPLTSSYTSGGTYYIEAKNWDNNKPNAVDIQNNPLTIYFDGNITFYGNNEQNSQTTYCVTTGSTLTLLKVRNGLTVYLAPGATLDLTKHEGGGTATFQNVNSAIYVNEGSTVKAVTLELVGGTKVRNEGTIEVDNLSINGQNQTNSVLWNEGTLKVKETIALFNQNGALINRDELTAQTLDMKSGGQFLNDEDAEVLIKGTSYITNTNSQWQNKGEYKTGDIEIKNTIKVFNNCKLTVTSEGTNGTGTFTFGSGEHAAFVLDGHASVKTETFIWGTDCDFYMKDYSMIDVEGQFIAKNNNKNWGLHGLGSGYSVLKAGAIVLDEGDTGGQSRMNYWGKIFVDTNTHFNQGFVDQKGPNEPYDQPYYYYTTGEKKTVMFKFLEDPCPITEPITGECHHGYTPPTVVEPAVWSYAFEDNRARCDFDMNDVVLRVNVNKDDDSKFDVTLVAAGCEYDNYVYLGDNLITWANGSEVHDALGADKGQMINTGRGVSKTPVTVTIPRNGSNPESAPFKIWPYKKDGEFGNTEDQKETTPIPITQLEGSGKAPLGIIVPNKWAWPTERTIITEAYSQFVKWATNAVHVEATDWYNHPTNGKVVFIQ